jgi:anti-sigma regulatory factor (Ser/Thr protein kinase)
MLWTGGENVLPRASVGALAVPAKIELTLQPTPHAAAQARIALDDLEHELGAALLKDLRLMVSELVTNSIRHSATGRRDSVELRAWLFENRFRIEVSDAGPGFRPVATAGRGEEEGGWGLFIVESLSDRWGAERRDGRTVVWFEIEMRPALEEDPAHARARSARSVSERGRMTTNLAAA